ncbi:phospholipase D-like domain-containing protein [Cupriavidus necator]|uniref:phospholipase D-like domain-containing protein n=1 Tax=Cupriavidus necator TaxID=106590 RepID=UPI0005B52C64|nr:phospholipase D-like domain-containing protein [Cupriavidus necator]
MRFKSRKEEGFQVFAVAGVNTVSFGITATNAARTGLLGFGVERIDHKENEQYFMTGMKVFPSVLPNPDETTRVSTYDHPIQSFVWDDFTAKPGGRYTYLFHPLRGTPKKLDRTATPIAIEVTTEELFTKGTHDIFFNRGAASSQAYAREFRNLPPTKIEDSKERQRALDWLSRELDEALLKFINQARPGDELLGCFYEFRYQPVAEALANAARAGVHLRLIVDAKDNSYTDKKGVFHKAFPRTENLAMLKEVKIPKKHYHLRQMRPNDIQHNKFMVLRRKGKSYAEAVWTGSTNLSMGGIHGQTNVGHWVRDRATAEAFRAYWLILESDPGALNGSSPDGRADNQAFTSSIEELSPTFVDDADIAPGITPIFSPRRGLKMLQRYVSMLSESRSHACVTLAFGVGKEFREALLQHDVDGPLTLLLIEKEDGPNPNSKNNEDWTPINSKNNVYKAFGAYLEDPVYQFAKETNTRLLDMNQHVAYIHSKFMLVDPIGDDPIVVTGSANFSDASTRGNDENMMIIRGDRRVADIYFTEFNRLFFHYYYRSVVQLTSRMRYRQSRTPDQAPQFLKETPHEWLNDYAPNKFKTKRVQMFAEMSM